MNFNSFIVISMFIFFVIWNIVSWLKGIDDEDNIEYEYYESSSFEHEPTKVKVVPIFHKGDKLNKK